MYDLLGSRNPMDLLDLPNLSDPTQRAIATMLNRCLVGAFFLDLNLALVLATKTSYLSMVYGNSTYSCFAYIYFGWLEKSKFLRFDNVVDWGLLGLTLCERYSQENLMADRGQVWDIYGGMAFKLALDLLY